MQCSIYIDTTLRKIISRIKPLHYIPMKINQIDKLNIILTNIITNFIGTDNLRSSYHEKFS